MRIRLILFPILLVLALAAAPAAQAATLTLSPTSGPDGTNVRATGSGYGKKLPGTLTFGSQQVASFKSHPRGTIYRSFVVPAGFSGATTVTARTNAGTGTASFNVTTPPPPPPPPGDVTTQPVDGGPGYYGRFTNPLPSDPSFFPVAAWLRPAADPSQLAAYKDFGLNVMSGVECPECANEQLIRDAGLHAIMIGGEFRRFNDIGSETVGYSLIDEVDMCCGPPDFAGGNGYQMLTDMLASLPQDGKLRYNNYGKGVMFWETDQDAARFVNEFQDVASNDIYWFTDPNERSRPGYRVASSYGVTVDRMRYLDSLDGRRMPIWNVVELGWPFTESATEGGRRILPDELRAAVWHSIIAGARGIVYFDHNFGPGTPGSTILGSGYADNRAMAKSVNAQIHQLAPVLNSPTVTSGFTHSSTVRAMAKLNGSQFTIFAGSRANTSSNATFNLPVGDTTATVVGEGRTIPVVNGSFTDSFGGGNAIHIYRIG
jgi:hypothetical protein